MKPLQGNLFWKFRAILLGHEHIDSLKKAPSASSEERVEDSFLKISRAEAFWLLSFFSTNPIVRVV